MVSDDVLMMDRKYLLLRRLRGAYYAGRRRGGSQLWCREWRPSLIHHLM